MALAYMDRWNLSVAAPLLMEEYGWNETTIGLLQSVFFYGFTASHLPGGGLADRFGGRRVLGTAVLFWSAITGLTSCATGLTTLVAARLALGLGEGVNMPSILNLVARWFPVEERTRATTIAVAGVHAGTLVALPLSAWIAASYGWRAVFQSYAVVGLAWVALWFATIDEAPPAVRDAALASPPAVGWKTLLRHRSVCGFAHYVRHQLDGVVLLCVAAYVFRQSTWILAQGERCGIGGSEPRHDRCGARLWMARRSADRRRSVGNPRAQGAAGGRLRGSDRNAARAAARALASDGDPLPVRRARVLRGGLGHRFGQQPRPRSGLGGGTRRPARNGG
jgi:MFS family permease